MHRFVGILGILIILGLAFLFSKNRRAIRYKTVAWGLGLQIVLALFWSCAGPYGQCVFAKLGSRAQSGCSIFRIYGSSFVFGELGRKTRPRGFIFAFQAFPPSFSSPHFSRCFITGASCRSSSKPRRA